jgi:hypothetical protein
MGWYKEKSAFVSMSVSGRKRPDSTKDIASSSVVIFFGVNIVPSSSARPAIMWTLANLHCVKSLAGASGRKSPSTTGMNTARPLSGKRVSCAHGDLGF